MKNKATAKRTPAVRIAIIGTGSMAKIHATNFSTIKGCRIVAACDIDSERVNAFAREHGIPKTFTSVDALLGSDCIDAVSIVTPDPFHAPIAIQCMKAGKHTLCEKPLALNYTDASKMVKVARKQKVINMVNLSYRNWPAIQAVAQLISSGGIGEPRHVEASYLQAWLVSRIWGDWRKEERWLWRLSTSHGSNGVLGDVGVHIVDFATFPVGPIRKVYCQLKTFPKIKGNRIGKYVLDANDSAMINVTFANGALGTIHTTRWCGGHTNRLFLKVAGTEGTVEIDSDRGIKQYRVCSGKNLANNTWREVPVKDTPSNYQRFVHSIRSGINDEPSFLTGAQVQKVLDACIESNQKDAPVILK